MRLKSRLAAVAVMAAAVCYGSIMGTEETDEGEVVEIPVSWFGQKETIHFWYSDENLSSFINSAAVAFGEKEGVRVLPELKADNEYLEAINKASLDEDRQMPDAYLLSHDSLEKAYLSGLATRIQDAAGICNSKNFPEAALFAATYRDKLVGYPLFFETSALVYNETYLAEWARQTAMKELLAASGTEWNPEEHPDGIPVDEALLAARTEAYFQEAVPATVEDILTMADSFDVPLDVEGVFKWDVSDIFYNYWFVGNYMIVGGEYGDDPAIIDINNKETIQCLEVYKALNQFFSIESDTVDYDLVVDDFCRGRTVLTVATTDVVRKLKEAEEAGDVAFDFGIALLPQINEELQSRPMSVTNVVAINGYSQHKALANRFAAYLVGECADSVYARTGRVAANLNADVDDEYLQVFKSAYAKSIPLPKMMDTGNFWMQLEGLFSKVWNGADAAQLVEELAGKIASQVR